METTTPYQRKATQLPSMFQIQNQYKTLMMFIEDNDGVIDEEVEKILTITQEQIQEKAHNYVLIIKEWEAKVAQAKEAAEQVAKYKKSIERNIEILKDNLLNAVNTFGPIETAPFKITTRKSEAIEIENEDELADRFFTEKVVKTASKTLIKEFFKEMSVAKIPGARLVQNQSLTIK